MCENIAKIIKATERKMALTVEQQISLSNKPSVGNSNALDKAGSALVSHLKGKYFSYLLL